MPFKGIDWAALEGRTPERREADRLALAARDAAEAAAARAARIECRLVGRLLSAPEFRHQLDGTARVLMALLDASGVAHRATWEPADRASRDALASLPAIEAMMEDATARGPQVELRGRWVERRWRDASGAQRSAREFDAVEAQVA